MRGRPLCILGILFLLIESIYVWAGGGKERLTPPATSIFALADSGKYNVSVRGTVYRKVRRSDYQLLYLKDNTITMQQQNFKESKLLVYDENFVPVCVGNEISVKGQASAFEKAHNPGNVSLQETYARQGFYGSVWSKKLKQETDKVYALMEGICNLRNRWNALLLKEMGSEMGPLLCAMLTGEKSEMLQESKELYQKNGISHLLAISGLHISFLGIGIYEILKKCRIGYKSAAGISIGVLVMYLLLIGNPTSALRAAMMFGIRLGAEWCGREYDMATALSTAAILTVGKEPLVLTDAGFLLSYGAILGILVAKPALEAYLPKTLGKRGGFVVSLSVQWFLLPLLLLFYYELSLYGVFLNVLILPLMPALLTLGMAGSILGSFWSVGSRIPFWGCDLILSGIKWLGEQCMKLPSATLTLGKPSAIWVAGYYLCLLCFLLVYFSGREKKEYRRGRLVYGSLLFAGFLLCQSWYYKEPGILKVTFLDVGQGDGIFLKGPSGGTYLVDGGSSDVSKVGQYRILPYLKSQGVDQLDYVFVTHGDSDHYSGILELLSGEAGSCKIGHLVLPAGYEGEEALAGLQAMAVRRQIPVLIMEPGMALKESGLSITCLQPAKRDDLTGNESSLILDVTYGTFDLLLTGDVEGEGEERLLKRLPKKSYDLVKAAHHGSKNANGEALLEKIKPQEVVFMAGRDNDYGHPHSETIKRYEKYTTRLYSTAKSGAITFKSDGKKLAFRAGFH